MVHVADCAGFPLLRRGEGVPPASRGDFLSPQPDRGEVWPGVFVTDAGVVIQTDLRLSGINTLERRPGKKWPDGTARSEASRDREKELARQARATQPI